MSDTKELTYSDVSEHTSKKDLYMVIHDKVYNASSFVDEHPYVYTLPLSFRIGTNSRLHHLSPHSSAHPRDEDTFTVTYKRQ